MPYDSSKMRTLIADSGIPTYRVAQKAEVPPPTIFRLTKLGAVQNPTVNMLEKIARVIGCEVQDFLSDYAQPSSAKTQGFARKKHKT